MVIVIDNEKMIIRLETSKRTGIDNKQEDEISAYEINWSRDINKMYPKVKVRTKPSSIYNCHGLTFASRRTRIFNSSQINIIVKDDNYVEVSMKDALPGDIVLYVANDGDVNHSGIVVEMSQSLVYPMICSMWGSAGEVIHGLYDCPKIYGPHIKFYRCQL